MPRGLLPYLPAVLLLAGVRDIGMEEGTKEQQGLREVGSGVRNEDSLTVTPVVAGSLPSMSL